MEIRPYRISNEFQFLIFACHYPSDTTHSKKIHTLIATHQLKWDKVMRLAITHRVIPLLYKNILQVERSKEFIPLEFFKQLKLLAQKMIHQNLLNTHHSLKLLRCFNDEEIRVIPYKGAILAI